MVTIGHDLVSLIHGVSIMYSEHLVHWLDGASSCLMDTLLQFAEQPYLSTIDASSGIFSQLLVSVAQVLPYLLTLVTVVLLILGACVLGTRTVTGCVLATRFTGRQVVGMVCVSCSAVLELLASMFLLLENVAGVARGCLMLAHDVLVK